MCNVKTMNLSVNVSREEGQFWSALAAKQKVRSVGELHKRLLLLALHQVAPQRARELMRIRMDHVGLGNLALLAVFLAAFTLGGHQDLRRAHHAPRVLVQGPRTKV